MSSESDRTLSTPPPAVSDIPASETAAATSSIDDDERASPLYHSMKRLAEGPNSPTTERAEAFYNLEGNPWSRIPDHDNALYLMEPDGSGKARFVVVACIIKGTDNDRLGPYFTAVGGDNLAYQKLTLDNMRGAKVKFHLGFPKESDDEPDVPPAAPEFYNNLLKIMTTAEGKFEELKVEEGGTKVIPLLVQDPDFALNTWSFSPITGPMYTNTAKQMSHGANGASRISPTKKPAAANQSRPAFSAMKLRTPMDVKGSIIQEREKIKRDTANGVYTTDIRQYTIYHMPDPLNLYENLDPKLNFNETYINVPDVRDKMGRLIHPAFYGPKIKPNALVLVTVHFKLWAFATTSDKPAHHIYHTVLESMHLLPSQQDIIDTMYRGKTKGKRPTEEDVIGSAPTKAIHIEDEGSQDIIMIDRR
ncbi:hypothetical protein C8J56DRAFT_1047894 [Mycena floridula]|nr:hypothetical protein C8J56DRAFT_1047894 [Mycena floridula]